MKLLDNYDIMQIFFDVINCKMEEIHEKKKHYLPTCVGKQVSATYNVIN